MLVFLGVPKNSKVSSFWIALRATEGAIYLLFDKDPAGAPVDMIDIPIVYSEILHLPLTQDSIVANEAKNFRIPYILYQPW